jgi:hypothetical protein
MPAAFTPAPMSWQVGVPVASMTSSTGSGGNALVSTPIEIRSGSYPSGDNPSAPS